MSRKKQAGLQGLRALLASGQSGTHIDWIDDRDKRIESYRRKIARGEKLFEAGSCRHCWWWIQDFGGVNGH